MAAISPPPSPRKRRAQELWREYLMPARVDAWEQLGVPLVIGRREGYRIWDLDGRELLDLHLNGGTYNLGHRNPELVELLRRSLDELDVGNHHFPSEARAELAEALARAARPGRLHYWVLVPSGSEANDLAMPHRAPCHRATQDRVARGGVPRPHRAWRRRRPSRHGAILSRRLSGGVRHRAVRRPRGDGARARRAATSRAC